MRIAAVGFGSNYIILRRRVFYVDMNRGYLKCPGNCDSIVGSFLLEPFSYGCTAYMMNSCSCGEQLVAKVIFDWNAFL